MSTTGASAIGYAYAAEIPQQRLRAKTAGWALASSNLVAIMFSFCTPLMINNAPISHWGVKTGFLLVFCHLAQVQVLQNTNRPPPHSFAGTGTLAVIIAWFILPEVTRRTPAEIDEMYVNLLPDILLIELTRFLFKVREEGQPSQVQGICY